MVMAIDKKLRDDSLWKEVFEVAQYMYGKLLELENFPDEKWTVEGKLRTAAFDALYFLANAISSGDDSTSSVIFDWNNARKSLFAVQTAYIFAGKQGFLELEPERVVQIDRLLKEYVSRIDAVRKENIRRDKADKEAWLEKHRLWQEMQT